MSFYVRNDLEHNKPVHSDPDSLSSKLCHSDSVTECIYDMDWKPISDSERSAQHKFRRTLTLFEVLYKLSKESPGLFRTLDWKRQYLQQLTTGVDDDSANLRANNQQELVHPCIPPNDSVHRATVSLLTHLAILLVRNTDVIAVTYSPYSEPRTGSEHITVVKNNRYKVVLDNHGKR